ncbi:MAG TPA: hypothetical protein VK718_01920 [Ferruginibacter sp.]|jgi:hypothetical protein|nr:hypothetical protein [Ferruginibacter sp.]
MKNTICLLFLICLLGCNNDKEQTPEQVETQFHKDHPELYPSKQIQIFMDSTTKYSYPMLMINKDVDNNSGQATCFFLRKNNRIFLVGSYHAFTGQNTAEKGKITNIKFDSLEIMTGQQEPIEKYYIDVRKIVKESKPCYFYEQPDIYVYEVTGKLPPGFTVYSIDKFIDPKFKASPPLDIFSIGYGQSGDGMIAKINFSLSRMPYDTSVFEYGFAGNQVKMTNSYCLMNQSIGGMSGSPVFFKYETNDKDSLVFGGVISTHIGNTNMTVIVKPSEVMKKIDKLLLHSK